MVVARTTSVDAQYYSCKAILKRRWSQQKRKVILLSIISAHRRRKKITEMDANGYGMAENDDWNDAPGADDQPLI
jgi:hypothetical protein